MSEEELRKLRIHNLSLLGIYPNDIKGLTKSELDEMVEKRAQELYPENVQSIEDDYNVYFEQGYKPDVEYDNDKIKWIKE